MEKKKGITTKKKEKSTKNVKKETISKTKSKKKKSKTKAFTLIELLAVIIILGVLMIIAIPSVTTYISNSRKNSYIDTAKNIIGAARNLVNSGKLDIYDTNTTYYISTDCIPVENNSTSPYGDFDPAYVVVGYNGSGYEYYWVSTDTSKQGIEITSFNNLKIDDIKTGIETVETNVGIGNRKEIKVIDLETCSTFVNGGRARYSISSDDEIIDNKIITSVVSGTGEDINDEVTIGDEHFYIIDKTDDTLVLLAKYNLYVGSIYDSSGNFSRTIDPSSPDYLKQNEFAFGYTYGGQRIATVPFSTNLYWRGPNNEDLYPGHYCSSYGASDEDCTYVYDDRMNGAPIFNGTNAELTYPSNYSVAYYVQQYKQMLNLGSNVEARLLKLSEATKLGCSTINGNCYSAPAWVSNVAYWYGNAGNPDVVSITYGIPGSIWYLYRNRYLSAGTYTVRYNGVRPVLVIPRV